MLSYTWVLYSRIYVVFDDEDEMVVQTEHRMVVPIKLCHYVALLSAHLMISITQNMELINDFLVF